MNKDLTFIEGIIYYSTFNAPILNVTILRDHGKISIDVPKLLAISKQ